MPKRTVYGDLVFDPNYDREQDVANAIQEVRAMMNKELQLIDSISDPIFQLICMFAMIDCLAQESAGYPIGNPRETFCDFVLKHQSRYNYLCKVEPITLYYHVEDIIEESIMISGLIPDKEVNIDSLGSIDMRFVKDIIHSRKAQEILGYIRKRKGKQFAAQKELEHRLINLIYRKRSKAIHEKTRLGEEMRINTQFEMIEPYYRSVGRIYDIDDEIVTDDIYELIIPNAFIRNILTDCIEGYLRECKEQCRLPFNNNKMTRVHYLSWYDK